MSNRHHWSSATGAIRRVPILFLVLAGLSSLPASADPEIRIEPLTLNFDQQAHPPIYVELDWMEDGTHSHRPSQAVVDRIVQTFAAAGYELHLDVSNAIPHQNVISITGSVESSVQSFMDQHFDHAGDNRYYYSLWGHNYGFGGGFTTSSGVADLPGRVHLVTLGSFSNQTGTFSNQVGTFIHEFGHNLGRGHGGTDHENYKPNYLSVMNYYFQLSGIGPSLFALGYVSSALGFDDFGISHGLMQPLNENNLDENFGIGLGRAIDWNCNGILETNVARDIQGYSCNTTGPRSTLLDHDDWSTLDSQIRTLQGIAAESPGKPVTCITPEEHQPLQERIDRLRALGLIPPEGASPPPVAAGEGARSFFIHNDGASTLTVSSLSLDPATSWIQWAPQAPFNVAPGKSQEVQVFIDLSQVSARQTTRRLLVESNDADESPYPGGVNLMIFGLNQPGADFFTLPPCRLLDTRSGAPLSSQVTYNFTLAGSCGIPDTAEAVSVNVTVVVPTASGHLVLWPSDQSKPGASSLNFRAGLNRANNAVVTLAADGSGAIAAQAVAAGEGTIHLLIDVNGYFE